MRTKKGSGGEDEKRISLPVVVVMMVLVMGTGSAQAFAATVAKIGSKSYSSFNAALKAVRSGQTIKLTKNYAGGGVLASVA